MIIVTGLGPGDFDRIPGLVQSLLLDRSLVVVARTVHHPAAAELASKRDVVFCDDLYESEETFDAVYAAIAERVLSTEGEVVYAVPGSPMLGEFAVRHLLDSGRDVEVIPGESFVDAVLAEVGYDPLDRGLSVLNAYELPDPLVLDKPTIVAQLDSPELLADVGASIGRVLPDDAVVRVLSGIGSADAVIWSGPPDEVDPAMAGLRTSLFVDAEPGGLVGAVHTMRRLRRECPWDREQTHQSLVKNLVEESYELIDVIERMPTDDVDWVSYAELEDELGDVLLQVLFHAVIARQAGAFDIDDAAEVMRQKLVRRHPHVFGDVEVGSAGEVKDNWDRIKEEERAEPRDSALDGVPSGMPALHRAAKIQNRAAKVGFDWAEAAQVIPKIREELDELEADLDDPVRAADELGDVLFSVVNLARHLGLDGELALRASLGRFEERFRTMEKAGPLDGLDIEELNDRWESAKRQPT